MMDAATEQAVLKRLARVEGQLKGIQRMVKDRRYCIEIIQQLTAARRALDQVSLQVMNGHINTCVSDAMRKREGTEKIKELMRTLQQFIK